MSRRCDAIGCAAIVNTGLFMCPTHWREVPPDLRTTINARFRVYKKKPLDLLRDAAYLEACAKAIERAQPEGTPPNTYRRLLTLQQNVPSMAVLKKPYIIRVWAGGLQSYLGVASDEDGDKEPPRTCDYDFAWKCDDFVEARKELRRVVAKYPALSFKLDVGVIG